MANNSMPLRKTLAKNGYRVVKGAVIGAPFGLVCMQALKSCVKDLSLNDLPSTSCRIFLYGCLPPVGIVTAVGAHCGPETFEKVKGVGKLLINVSGFIYTGPSSLVNVSLKEVEICIFGEAVPVGATDLLLLSS